MNQFVTVSKKDEQFWPMLNGRFSSTHYAQPIKNLYVNSANETVTFKIVEKTRPPLLKALSQWYSLARNIYLIFPILGGVSFLVAKYGQVPLDLLLFSFLSLQTFLMSLTLYNDYTDYVHGVDRVNDYSADKPLVQGLIRPYQAKRLAQIFLGLSILLSAYCFLARPSAIVFAVIALAIGFFFSSPWVNKTYKGLSAVMTFVLAGPLLVLGYEYLFFEKLSWGSAILGFIFGTHALKYDFCKQTRDIYYNSKAKVVTASTFFGFEKSKWIYSLISLAHILALVFFVKQFNEPLLFMVVIVAVCFEFYINMLFYGAQSFLSSNVGYCMGLQKLHYTIESCLLVFFFLNPLWSSLL